jgi:hypothetical protein
LVLRPWWQHPFSPFYALLFCYLYRSSFWLKGKLKIILFLVAFTYLGTWQFALIWHSKVMSEDQQIQDGCQCSNVPTILLLANSNSSRCPDNANWLTSLVLFKTLKIFFLFALSNFNLDVYLINTESTCKDMYFNDSASCQH